MERKTIQLNGDRELRIFMDPLRQRMLRTMEVLDVPVTPKKLADTMDITPSSAKHHLSRLESIGLVCVDHTEQIHGITAVFYARVPATVSIGVNRDDHREERAALSESLVTAVYEGFRSRMPRGHEHPEREPFWGDTLTGVLHLTQAQADDLYARIRTFIEANETHGTDTEPYEYALVLYRSGAGHATQP